MSWRYIAVRLDGSAQDLVVHPEVPIAVDGLTDVLSGPPALSGTIPAAFAGLQADDNRPLFDEWGTAIFPERDGFIQPGGGIITSAVPTPTGGLAIECSGYTAYPDRQPWTGDRLPFREADRFDVFRAVWNQLQSHPDGNLGLTIDSHKSGLLIGGPAGTPTDPTDKDAESYNLTPYGTPDVQKVIDELAADHFDYYERHWWEGAVLRHHLSLGAPQIGTRRDDAAFVVGDNVTVRPTYASRSQEYASGVVAFGAGEGHDIARGNALRPTNRLRRILSITDKGLPTPERAQRAAVANLLARNSLPTVSQLVVRDHPNARLSGIQLGDEYQFQDDTHPFLRTDTYVRVVSRTINPKRDGVAELTVVRTQPEVS